MARPSVGAGLFQHCDTATSFVEQQQLLLSLFSCLHASITAAVNFPMAILVLSETEYFIPPQQHLMQHPKDHKYLRPESDSKLFEG